jgi:hypothetical protein
MNTQSETPIDYFEGQEDAQAKAEAEPMTLQRFIAFANEAQAIEKDLLELAAQTAKKDERLQKILRDLIPSAMKELGLNKFELTDGTKIGLETVTNASIKAEFKPQAFAYLEEKGDEAIIKTNVHADFGKGEMEEAKRAVDALIAAGFEASLDRNIHPSTLRSYVVEQLEAGANLPLDVFGVFQFDRAKITRPKTKRSRT